MEHRGFSGDLDNHRGAVRAAVTVLAITFGAAMPAAGQQLTWWVSAGYFEGAYGTSQTTRAFVLTNQVTLQSERWSLSLDVPVVDVDGPATPFIGNRPIPPRKEGGGDGQGPGGGAGGDTGGGGDDGGGNGDGGGDGNGNGSGGGDGSGSGDGSGDGSGSGDGGGGDDGGGNGNGGGSGDGNGNGDGSGSGSGDGSGGDDGGGVGDGSGIGKSHVQQLADDGAAQPVESGGAGIADPLLRFTYRVSSGEPDLRLFAAVKVPFNDASRPYATGAWDAGAGVALGRHLGRFYGRGEVAWWTLGDPPGGELEDPWVVRLELGRPLGFRWWAAMAVNAAGETVPGTGDAASVEVTMRRRVATGVIGAVVAVGLTDATPDLTLALQWQLGG